MAKRGLGRGLNALIPSMGKPSESESNVIVELSLDSIIPNRNQPRNNFDDDSLNDLAESIKKINTRLL
jgi:ParB family chromosome partitioning protein